MSSHFPDSTPTTSNETPYTSPLVPQQIEWINEPLYWKAVNKFGPDKAPGPDGLKPIILQNLNSKAISRLLQIYNSCITNSYTPQTWRQSRTIFIPKLNKEDYTNVRAFRPISLTSFLLKTLERLVLWNIERTCLNQIPYHPNQHAFRKGHSTETALSEVVQRIEKAYSNNNYYLAVFLDIEGAFDNITNEAILQGMENHKVPHIITKWYKQYLYNRSCHSTLGQEKVEVNLSKGTPQGGVLSPPCWNMNYDEILEIITQQQIDATGFADDLMAGKGGQNLVQLVQELQHAINLAVAWGHKCGLKFSPEKSSAVLFHRKRKNPQLISLQINQINIPYQTTTKYLGMTIDRKLNWSQHISQKSKMAKSLLYLTKRAIGATWGPQPSLAKWAYTGIVRPKLTYGCHLWANCSQQKSKLKTFRTIQRAALLPLGPVRQQTPTSGLEIITNTTPLDLQVIELSLNSLRTINRQQPTHWKGPLGSKESHLYFLDNIMDSIHLTGLPDDRITATYPSTTTPSYTINLNSLTNRADYKPSENHSPIEIYTDGSHINNKTGYGYSIYRVTDTTSELLAKGNGFLGSHATVFQAETYAIEAAIQHFGTLLETCRLEPNPPINIYSDSQATLRSLMNQPTNSKTTLSCPNTLNTLGQTNKLTLNWVKAHCGIQGNELADSEAKTGAYLSPSGPEPWLPLPTTFFKRKIKELIHFHWTNKWSNIDKCRQTKLFFHEPNPSLSKQIMKCTKHTFGKAIRWITGHCFMRRHKHITDPFNNPDPKCRHCNEEDETPWHIIARCGAFQHIRVQCFGRHEHSED